ncbi:MAG: isochorismatase family cysteine hydrolase [bacterium]
MPKKSVQIGHVKLTPKNSALLVIDMTNFCAHEKCEIKQWNIIFKKIRKMAKRLVKFIELFKTEFGGKVIYVNCTPWEKEYLAPNIVELYKDPKARYYSKDTSGFSEEFHLVRPEKDDFIVTKNTYDAFTNPKLEKYLKKNKIKYVIVTGIFSEGCVHATINGGFSKGFNFVILKDLVETADDKKRQQMQKDLIDRTWPLMFGKTVSSKELVK